ncbi:MAG: pyridoxamine kinase [Tannerella sp.]|jgi:pyridoxine kinase|nr:pyridoxamine kinase [Tannerella sp.]
MKQQKRVAAIHDISGFGKCSLTVALPILSAAGIETSVVPTAVLSTHTGGFTGYTYRDLTEDIRPFIKHWKSLNLTFDALYSGFLGSFEQIEIIGELFDAFKTPDNVILIDPVMADNGVLYSIFTPDFAQEMKKLCRKADIIVPNITEASLLVGEPYVNGPYTEEYICNLLKKLSDIGPRQIVLTGVFLDDRQLGAATYDAATGEIAYLLSGKIPGYYHGTGDVFGSALLAALLNGFDLTAATRIAVNFTVASIRRTFEAQTDIRFGVNFEQGVPEFLKELKLINRD